MRILIIDEENMLSLNNIKNIHEITCDDLILNLEVIAQMDRIIVKFNNKFKIVKDRYSANTEDIIFSKEAIKKYIL